MSSMEYKSKSEGAGPVVGLLLLLGIGVMLAAIVFALGSSVTLTVVETVPTEDYDGSYEQVGVGEGAPDIVEELIVSEGDSINGSAFDYQGAYEYEGTVYVIESSEHFSLFGFEFQYA